MSSVPPHPALSPDGLARLIDLAEDAIVSTTADGRIVLFNRGAERTFGYGREEVMGRSLEMLIPGRFAEAHRRHVANFAEGDSAARWMRERTSVCGVRKDGSEFPAEVTISKSRDGGQLYLSAIIRDVTVQKKTEQEIRALNHDLEARVEARTAELEERVHDRLRAEAALRETSEELRATTQQLWQAAKLASVGELAASIAHELNNPLGTVSLRLETVLAKTPAEAPTRPLLGIVEQEVERMARLVGNLLQFSRNASDQVSTVSVCEEVRKSAELTDYHLRRRGVTVVHDFPPGQPTIFADRQKLRQVFLNLFTNAGDAMPNGGTLTIRVRPARLDGGRAAVEIEVSDTGQGIPNEHLPRVMDPFFTTKPEGKGTGLGLAICRRIVQDHKGTIALESSVGKGTTVRIMLPVQEGGNVRGLCVGEPPV
jgi:PAS domain S-box-containing protein